MPDEEHCLQHTVPWGWGWGGGGGTGQRARSVPDKDHSPLHTIPLGELDEEHSPLTALHTIHLGCRTKITLPYTQSIWGAGQKSRSLTIPLGCRTKSTLFYTQTLWGAGQSALCSTHNPLGVPDKEHSLLHKTLGAAGQRALSSTQNPGGCRTDSTLHNHIRCRSESTPLYIHSRGGAGQTPCFSAHNPVRVPDKEHAALNSSDCHDWSTRRFCTKGQVVSQGYASSRCWDLLCGQMSERKRQQLPSCA